MPKVEDVWASLMEGKPAPPLDDVTRKFVVTRAIQESKNEDPSPRMMALQVLQQIDQLDSAVVFSDDPDLDIRRRLLEHASEPGAENLFVLRALCTDPDPRLALDCIATLTTLGDTSATGKIRRQLRSEHPVVRGRAAVFLGFHGGPSVTPTLRAMRDDADQGVRGAVEWAIARLEGATDTAPPKPGQSWHRDSATPHDTGDAPKTPQQPAVPSMTALRLFESLGDQPESAADLLPALQALPNDELSRAFRAQHQDTASTAALGAAIAAWALEEPRWVQTAFKLTSSDSVTVRKAATKALGVLCGPSHYKRLELLLIDSDETVQESAILALAHAATRLGYERQALRLVEDLDTTKSKVLTKAKNHAQQTLGDAS